MASDLYMNFLWAFEEIGKDLNKGDDYFEKLYSYIPKDELDEYKHQFLAEDLTEALEDYKLTYYLSTATAERRPETIEDVENDWKEEVFAADSDYDALLYTLKLIDSGYDDTDFSTAEEVVKYFEEKDLGDGSAFVVKLEGPNGVIYDMGQTKDDFIEQVKQNDEMLGYYRSVLGIDESLEESLRNPKPSMFKRLCKSSDKALCQKACEIMYDWYSNEDAFGDFNTVTEFIDYVSDDIYNMIDAASDEEEIEIVLAALSSSNQDMNDLINFIKNNLDKVFDYFEVSNLEELLDNAYLDEISEELTILYEKNTGEDVPFSQSISLFRRPFKKFLKDQGITEIDESLNEAIDYSKALEVKKNSDADVIFYGYQYKNEDPVEIAPEELSSEEYEIRKKRIVSDYNKLNANKPTGNRYAKGHDFIFYALYNRKNESNEKADNKMNESKNNTIVFIDASSSMLPYQDAARRLSNSYDTDMVFYFADTVGSDLNNVGYQTRTEKVIKYIEEHPNYNYVIITDDDPEIRNSALKNLPNVEIVDARTAEDDRDRELAIKNAEQSISPEQRTRNRFKIAKIIGDNKMNEILSEEVHEVPDYIYCETYESLPMHSRAKVNNFINDHIEEIDTNRLQAVIEDAIYPTLQHYELEALIDFLIAYGFEEVIDVKLPESLIVKLLSRPIMKDSFKVLINKLPAVKNMLNDPKFKEFAERKGLNNKINEDMSVRAKLKALYPELNFGDEKNEALPLATLAASAVGSLIGKKLAEEIDDDMDFDIDESHETRLMDSLYEGSDYFDEHDDEALEEFSDCGDDECWENDLISDDYDDGM